MGAAPIRKLTLILWLIIKSQDSELRHANYLHNLPATSLIQLSRGNTLPRGGE